MAGLPSLLWKRMGAFIESLPVNPAEKVRLRHYTVLLLVGGPGMLAYGLYHLANGEYVLSSVILGSLLGLLGGWYVLARMDRGIVVYRLNAALFGVLLAYLLILGGDGGSKILWMYTFPLVAVFLMGELEGTLWAGGILLFGAALLLGAVPGLTVYPYPDEFRDRFFATYLVEMVFIYWFEHFRATYFTGMEARYVELEKERGRLESEILERRRIEREREEAVAQVRVLRGLLPICSSCKKIRDEEGKWSPFERYIDERSEAKFSHGICPDCAKRLYPGFVE